jgi:hypothetical protein
LSLPISHAAVDAIKQILTDSKTSPIESAVKQVNGDRNGHILVFTPSQQMMVEMKQLLEREGEKNHRLASTAVYMLSRHHIEVDYKVI